MKKGLLSLVHNNEERHRVTLIRDHELKYPELYLDVFVVGPRFEESAFAEMFARAGCRRASSIGEADLIVFTGGPDVDPALYGEKKHPSTKIHPQRDAQDIKAYQFAVSAGIPMLGVCRGAQFLHVMNGGKLYQDVDGHYGDHSMFDLKTKEVIQKVSSVHHQMVKQNIRNGMTILASSSGKSKTRWLNDKEKNTGSAPDIEAFFYRDTCCLGVQGHPEYTNYPYFTVWTLKQIDEYVILNPDIDWVNSRRRMKPDLVLQREAKRKEKK